MRLHWTTLVTLALLATAGCATTAPGTSTTTDPGATIGDEQRFDGDANAHVRVTNPTDEVWNATFRIERDGTTVLEETRLVRPDGEWEVAIIDRPGDYRFGIETGAWSDDVSVRLPRAVGDRNTFVNVVRNDGKLQLIVYFEE